MSNKKIILDYLKELIEEPKIELNYNKDYELLLAVMLSAQTTDIRVNQVTSLLFFEYDSLEKLRKADVLEIEKIIRPIGTYKVKAKNLIGIAQELGEDYNLNDREFLESLPGVGRKTANVVLANLFKHNVIAVDTHVKRVSIRLGIANKKDSIDNIEFKLNKYFNKDLSELHHRLVLFGRYYCKARNPNCENCRLYNICLEDKKIKERHKKIKY